MCACKVLRNPPPEAVQLPCQLCICQKRFSEAQSQLCRSLQPTSRSCAAVMLLGARMCIVCGS